MSVWILSDFCAVQDCSFIGFSNIQKQLDFTNTIDYNILEENNVSILPNLRVRFASITTKALRVNRIACKNTTFKYSLTLNTM